MKFEIEHAGPRCKCGNSDLDKFSYWRFIQYRPKEFKVECEKCHRFSLGKGTQLHVMNRKFNSEWGPEDPIDYDERELVRSPATSTSTGKGSGGNENK